MVTTVIRNPPAADVSVARAAFAYFSVTVLLFFLVILVSGRRRTENRLREQSELLQVTLSSIGDAVIATDTDGRVTFMNPAAETVTGWNSDEARGRPLIEVYRLEGASAAADTAQLPTATERRGEARHAVLITRDGREVPIDESRSPIRDPEGRTIGAVTVFHDVSHRRQIEEEREALLESERLARTEAEAANRMKDEFLATVSHELRTPLNSILGWSAMLRGRAPDGAEMEKGLAVIERNARAQNQIISDILDVSRIVTGKMNIEFKPVDIIPSLRAAVDAVYPAARAKSITIHTNFDHSKPVVSGDPDRLQQIFWNLLANSVKFTPAGGEVTISLGRSGESVEVRFEDTGVGISGEFLPFVFDRFRQVDSSIKRSHGGLGLGLAIVRHLVELHGGAVRAESSGQGTGAAFTVSLPLASVPADTDKPANGRGKGANLSGLRVLVVDDHPDTVEMFCFSLEQFGAETRSASSCGEALEVFSDWKPDVLISDLGMPGEDGFDLIARIRALGPAGGGAIPAAAVTAYARETDRAKALAAGFQMHIAKPIAAEDLAEAVAALARMNETAAV